MKHYLSCLIYYFYDFVALVLHSPPLHFAAFSLFCPGSLELCFAFPLLLRCQLSSCRFPLCLQLQRQAYFFFQSLFNLTQITFNSTCLIFVFHLCFEFLAQQCVSLSNSTLADFESGELKAVQIVCNIFFPDLASRNASFFVLKSACR